MTRCTLAILAILLAGQHAGQNCPAQSPTTRAGFRYLDVLLDSHEQPLAAYQLEITSRTGNMTVVGIEGGEHPAFAAPPFHDKLEMVRNRVVLAAYSTAKDLPRGRTRVARIMIHVETPSDPQYTVKLVVAGNAEAKPIPAEASVAEGEAR